LEHGGIVTAQSADLRSLARQTARWPPQGDEVFDVGASLKRKARRHCQPVNEDRHGRKIADAITPRRKIFAVAVVKLSDFFDDKTTDRVNGRRIIKSSIGLIRRGSLPVMLPSFGKRFLREEKYNDA
jgi:hypothetical protein